MGWKIVIAMLILSGGCYFFYLRQQEQQRLDFCTAIEECLSQREFKRDFVSVDRCMESAAGEQAMNDFEDCDEDLECDDWLTCGYKLELKKIKHEKLKSDFEQILPHVEVE